jgi:hypothetical protein
MAQVEEQTPSVSWAIVNNTSNGDEFEYYLPA